jgi:hypothetical protein
VIQFLARENIFLFTVSSRIIQGPTESPNQVEYEAELSFLSGCVHVYVCVCVHAHVFMCLCECTCTFVCVFTCLCVYASAHPHACVCVCVCARARVRACIMQVISSYKIVLNT